ncbi:MAG: phosphate acyltransferase, partial [Cyanobacteria bacterium P01_A01_bin.116]
GGLLLGVAGIAVISHGSSKAPSIFNAVRLAKDAVDNNVLDRIRDQYQKVAAIAKAPAQAPLEGK